MESCPVCLESAVPAVDLRWGRYACSHRICTDCDEHLRSTGQLRCPLCRSVEEVWHYDTPYFAYLILEAPPHLRSLVGLHRIPWAVLEWRLGFRRGEMSRPPAVPGLVIAHVYSLLDAVSVAGYVPSDVSHLAPHELSLALASEVGL